MKTLFNLAFLFWLASGPVQAALLNPGTYKVDPARSEVTFNITNFLVMTVDGRFKTFEANIQIGDKLETSRVQATVETRSIDTGNEERDTHLRTPDFFEVEKYPNMTFRSTLIAGTEADFKMTGELTIKGVSKDVTFDCHAEAAPDGGSQVLATAKIHREDFGITSGGTIKNEVRLKLRMRLTSAKSGPGA
jgi:polyisoprenoid-binding protein YceI